MNEFEKKLRSLEPAQGKTDVMQIMFRAGQQLAPTSLPTNINNSSQFNDGAGGWRIATGLMTAACLVLAICLANTMREGKNDDPVAKSNSKSEVSENDAVGSPNLGTQIDFVHLEPRLGDPASWSSLGHRANRLKRHTVQDFLKSDLRDDVVIDEQLPVTPFTFRRTKIKNTF